MSSGGLSVSTEGEFEIPVAFEPLFEQHRYKVFYGGRGGAKSISVAMYYIACILQETTPGIIYGCFRDAGLDLSTSVKPLLMQCAVDMGVGDQFYTTSTSSRIKCLRNGCDIVFVGLGGAKKAIKTKSMHNIRKAWVEEGEFITEEIWEIFTPSIRGSDDAEIIVTFNPYKKSDYLYQLFVANEPPQNAMVKKVLYYDNPHFSLVLEKERQSDLKYPAKYQRVWLGKAGHIEMQLLKPEWWMYYDSIQEVMAIVTGMFITADTAYKTGTMNDYTVYQCWGYNGANQLYLLDQIRGKWEFPTLVQKAKDFASKCCRLSRIVRPHRIFIEDKVSGISLVQTLAREGYQAIAWKPRDYLFPEDKVGRVNESALIISRNLVFLPRYAAWLQDYIDEHSEFSEDSNNDTTTKKDQVDATTMGVSIWRALGGGTAP